MSAGAPDVRYSRRDGVSVAYQRWGQGDTAAVMIPGLVSNLDLMWELHETTRALRRSGRALDMVLLDKRGTGLSDRVSAAPDIETHAADVIGILDQEHIERASLFGVSEGGVVALVAAALFPDRVINVNTSGTPVLGASDEQLSEFADPTDPVPSSAEQGQMWRDLVRVWGTPDSFHLDRIAPGAPDIAHIAEWNARFERQSASPGSLRDHLRSLTGFDLRPYLPEVRCPVQVTHSTGDRLVHDANSRLLATLLDHATLVEFPSDAHMWWLTYPHWEEIQDRLDDFALGRSADHGTTTEFAAVLITDIVHSTRLAAELGDEAWRQLVELHDSITSQAVTRHGGTVIKTTGDGVIASFDAPDRALDCALGLQAQFDRSQISIRAGVHAGQIQRRDDGDIAGLTVNIAARIESLAGGNEVLVSGAIRDMLLGTGHEFDDRGEHQLKGIDGTWRLYRATT